MVRAVVFDIGGVLAHDVWEHLFYDDPASIAARYELNADEVKKVGDLLWDTFAHMKETPALTCEAMERQYWQEFVKFFKEWLPQDAQPDLFIRMTDDFIRSVDGEAMTLLLERLQSAAVDLAICSNNNEFWYRRQMDKLGFHRFFSSSKTILSCRVGVSKSSPRFEMFHAVTDALRVTGAECIFVDDRKSNVEKSLLCGMKGILFSRTQDLDSVLTEMGL